MPAEQWSALFSVERLDGTPMPLEEIPGGIALLQQQPGARALAHDRARRRPARALRDGVPAARAHGRARRRREHLLGGLRRARARIWGCRGSLATPGRRPCATAATRPASRSCWTTARSLVLDAGTGARALGLELTRRRPDPSPAHASPPRPPRGPRLLRADLESRNEVHIWGPASPVRDLARADRRATSRRRSSRSSSPTSRRSSSSTTSPTSRGDRRRPRGGRPGRAPRTDGRLPDRGGRRRPRVHPGPRAGARAPTSRS